MSGAAAAAPSSHAAASAASAAPPLVDAVAEFLEAAVHALLRARGPYPPELFEDARLYGIATPRARHPGLRAYIAGVVANVRPLLAAGALHELVAVFSDARGAPISKVSFIIRGLAPSLSGAAAAAAGTGAGAGAADGATAAVEAALRSALLKLRFVDNLAAPLPPGATFELLALASSRAGIEPSFWAEEGPAEEAEAVGGGALLALPAPVAAVPVKSVHLAGVLSMQVVLEEAAAGGAAAAATSSGGDAQQQQ